MTKLKETYLILSLLFLSLFHLPSFAYNKDIALLKNTGKAFSSVAKTISQAVVYIQVAQKTATNSHFSNNMEEELLRRFFGFPDHEQRYQNQPKQQITSSGSGFIFDTRGYILTNHHVVDNAAEIRVTLKDGRKLNATLVGSDPKSDVAVIKITAKQLSAIKLGDSDRIEVGEWAIAAGSPFGLQQSITVGIISAKGRNSVGINDFEDFIQTDASINVGNSGGPLVNLDAEAIGMNSAILSKSGGSIGVGFAIPINMIKNISRQLMDKGVVKRGYIGVMIQPFTKELATSFNMKYRLGIFVAQVSTHSPAEKAGIRPGDIIIAFDAKKVRDIGQFRNRVSMIKPGKRKKITIIRNNRKKKFTIKIGELGNQQALTNTSNQYGFEVENIEPMTTHLNNRTDEGVIISTVDRNSVAENSGLKPGMIIKEVNRHKITNKNQFYQALNNDSERVLLLVETERYSRYILLNMR